MNHDLANLLEALRDRPDDKVAYLALADWCLEQRDEAMQSRGEHVRLSLALDSLSRTAPTAHEIRKRVAALEKRWRVAWLGPLREFGHRCDFLPGGLVQFEVTSGRITQEARLGKLEPIKDEQFAWVSSLVTRSITLEDLGWLASVLPAGHVRSFQMESRSAEGLVEVLSGCPWLQGLRALDLYSYGVRLRDAEVVRLASLDRLSELCRLRLSNVDLQVPGCSALSHSPHLHRLRELDVSSCGLTPPACGAFFSTACASALATLTLENNGISRPAAEVLAYWPALAHVRKLILNRNPLGTEGLTALAQSSHLGELRELSLQQCGLTTRSLQALARSPLGRLESLDIRFNDGIGDAGLLAICESKSLASLSQLYHSRYGIRGRTVTALHARFGTGHNPPD